MTNLVGAHVTYCDEAGTLIGEVRQHRGNDLAVYFFNGDPWPFAPVASEVTVLERAYPMEREVRNIGEFDTIEDAFNWLHGLES